MGPELAKYYVFTGGSLKAQELLELGIVSAVVKPVEVEAAIQTLVSKAKPDKYRRRSLPEKFQPLASLFSGDRTAQILAGKMPGDVATEPAARAIKAVGYKAPLALKMAGEIIDAQQGKSIPEAVEVELMRLAEIFSTRDALEGLSSMGRKRPEYKGK